MNVNDVNKYKIVLLKFNYQNLHLKQKCCTYNLFLRVKSTVPKGSVRNIFISSNYKIGETCDALTLIGFLQTIHVTLSSSGGVVKEPS